MSAAWNKLFDFQGVFASPVTTWVTIAVAALLVLAPIVIEGLFRAGGIGASLRREMHVRCIAWFILAPLLLGPVLLGPGVTILAVGALSLLCYREFARATGCFRHRLISTCIVLGILALTFAAYDHWYNFFVALPSLGLGVIVIVGLLDDEPKGYIQRVAIGILCFLLFGVCLGHLGYLANDANFRAILLTIVLCVELNDVFAFISGKTLGRRKLAPKTSPNKTIGGAIGAVILTTGLFVLVGRHAFEGSPLAAWPHLIAMGMMISIVGQFGDLVMSSVKRDLGIKDMGASLPGHGGLLDRFDSLLLIAPAMFHYIGYFQGIGLDQATRVITQQSP